MEESQDEKMGVLERTERAFCADMYQCLCGCYVCKVVMPFAGCGFCLFCTLALIAIVWLHSTVLVWFPAFCGFGPLPFATEMQSGIKQAFQTGNFDEVQRVYRQHAWLDESVLILGSAQHGHDAFVDRRGADLSEHVSIRYDKKQPVASGSKFFAAVTIYAVMEHPLTNLTLKSRPTEYFPFWNCSDPSDNDMKCKNVTLEMLMAFRHGLRGDVKFCERGYIVNKTWDECALDGYVTDTPYDPSRFDVFEYSPVGFSLAANMAVKEMNKVPGFEGANWDDIKQVLVLDKANITDAPLFDQSFYENGIMTYDYDFVSHSGNKNYDGTLPDVSASLGASPEQYSMFMHALLAGRLVSSDAIESITRSRGPAQDFYGLTLLSFSDYGQGMWINEPKKIAHSIGYYGFFPWIDQSDPDPANHFFGIIAVNYRVYFPWAMGILLATLTPVFVIGILLFGGCCTVFRLNESHYRSQLCCPAHHYSTFSKAMRRRKKIDVSLNAVNDEDKSLLKKDGKVMPSTLFIAEQDYLVSRMFLALTAAGDSSAEKNGQNMSMCICATGGASSIAGLCPAVSDASNAIVEVYHPCTPFAVKAYAGVDAANPFCSKETSLQIAQGARNRAVGTVVAENGIASICSHAGLGLGFIGDLMGKQTSSTKFDGHQGHAALVDNEGRKYFRTVRFTDGLRTQEEEDFLCSVFAVSLLADYLAAIYPQTGQVLPEGLVGLSDRNWKGIEFEDSQVVPTLDEAHQVALKEVQDGQRAFAVFWPYKGQHGAIDHLPFMDLATRSIPVIVCGSSNTLNPGHEQLARAAVEKLRAEDARKDKFTILFEISMTDGIAGMTDIVDVSKHLQQYSPTATTAGSLTIQEPECGKTDGWPVIVTAEPVLTRKARLFPSSVMVIGLDVALRLIDPNQYNGSVDNMVQALLALKEHKCRVVVGGRTNRETKRFETFAEAAGNNIPLELKDVFVSLSEAEFRMDLSPSKVEVVDPADLA